MPPPLGLGVVAVETKPRSIDFTSTIEEGDLIGGDAVRLIHAPIQDAEEVLAQPDALWVIMPRVVEMTQVGGTDDDRLYEVKHALGPVTGGYTMRFVRQRADASAMDVWFWVDTSRPRDLRFAWGAFRLMPFGRGHCLLAYQVRIELAPGLAKWLLSDRIRRAALTVADRARALIEDRVRYLPSRAPAAAR